MGTHARTPGATNSARDAEDDPGPQPVRLRTSPKGFSPKDQSGRGHAPSAIEGSRRWPDPTLDVETTGPDCVSPNGSPRRRVVEIQFETVMVIPELKACPLELTASDNKTYELFATVLVFQL